jgi:hypothetical protein
MLGTLPLIVASVPDVGNVTLVAPVVVNVTALDGVVVKFPPNVIVLPVFATPVPPYCPLITDPFQVPVPIVPTDVNDEFKTPEFRVDPVNVPAAAGTVISAVPLKLTPLINRAFCNAVAVDALPIKEAVIVPNVGFENVPRS